MIHITQKPVFLACETCTTSLHMLSAPPLTLPYKGGRLVAYHLAFFKGRILALRAFGQRLIFDSFVGGGNGWVVQGFIPPTSTFDSPGTPDRLQIH